MLSSTLPARVLLSSLCLCLSLCLWHTRPTSSPSRTHHLNHITLHHHLAFSRVSPALLFLSSSLLFSPLLVILSEHEHSKRHSTSVLYYTVLCSAVCVSSAHFIAASVFSLRSLLSAPLCARKALSSASLPPRLSSPLLNSPRLDSVSPHSTTSASVYCIYRSLSLFYLQHELFWTLFMTFARHFPPSCLLTSLSLSLPLSCLVAREPLSSSSPTSSFTFRSTHATTPLPHSAVHFICNHVYIIINRSVCLRWIGMGWDDVQTRYSESSVPLFSSHVSQSTRLHVNECDQLNDERLNSCWFSDRQCVSRMRFPRVPNACK